jgi:carbonic anhydrase/acetyltransferase-like protein (isoleucine patch superfamily)
MTPDAPLAVPTVAPEAWVASSAIVEGHVTILPGARVFHGAILASAGAELIIGPHTVVREGAVIRATARHPCRIGRHCLVGPHTHVVGAEIGDEVFIATGATLLHGCRLGRGVEVRINGVVHIRTVLPQDAVVPIGWVAVGDPAQLFPPNDHDAIWAVQKPLDFPGFVYGFPRGTPDLMRRITEGEVG